MELNLHWFEARVLTTEPARQPWYVWSVMIYNRRLNGYIQLATGLFKISVEKMFHCINLNFTLLFFYTQSNLH